MAAPRLIEEPMMRLQVTLHRISLGRTTTGERTEVPFEGTATSPHWEGEWTVTGVDHIRRGSDGIAHIDVHTVVTNGDESLLYRGVGRGGPNGIIEGVTFETSSDRLAWLNTAVAVGRGVVDGAELRVEIFQIA
jgi:hypothetical protein